MNVAIVPLRLLLLLFALVAATTAARTGTESIDAFVAAEMRRSGAPGVAYAVVEGDHVRAGAQGELLAGSGRPVTTDTPFLLGSITKSFTALAVMELVEAGKVDLDAGISTYLAAFRDRPAGAITVRQLLSHTSGYSTVQGNDAHADRDPADDDLSRQVARIASWAPVHPPGTRWEYSNANYQLLGAIIEAVSDRDYARFIESEILAPLGMEHSFVADGERHDAMARGHRPWFGGKRARKNGATQRVMAPAGGVIASAGDVARYLAVMMNGRDDIVAARSKAAMLRPASPASPFYGLGWFVDAENGTVSHSGSSPGIETLATLIPAQRKGVVVLVNAGSGIGFGETAGLRNGVTARALGLDYPGEGSRWSQKAVFVGLAVLPLLFVLCIAWAWRHRAALRAKSGPFGLFSLWFPLFSTIVVAWALLYLVPRLFGASMATLRLFQPDLALVMVATAVTAVAWAIFRLALAYGRPAGARSGDQPAPLTTDS